MRSAARSIRSWYCSYISANNARSPSLSNTDKKHESIRYYPTLQPCEHSTTTTCVFLPASHHVSISLWTLFKKQSLHQSRVYQKSLYTNELSRTVCPFLYPRQLSAARRRQGGRLARPRKNTRLPRGETMLASLLTLARFRPLSAVLLGASVGGDPPHRTPPQRPPSPPDFRCTLEHSTVQDCRLPVDLRPAP